MSHVRGSAVWVFHRGALGDSVLVWPMLRSLKAGGRAVTLVTDGSKARLAGRELGVAGLDAEEARFARLWVPGGEVEAIGGVGEVIAFMPDSVGESVWMDGAARMFPVARMRPERAPLDRVRALALAREAGGRVEAPARRNPAGPLVLHVGAGSREKRWPLEQWAEVARTIEGPVEVIAGEVEAERFDAGERAVFAAMGGRFAGDLGSLAAVIGGAKCVVGVDSGPAHLAAQMGVATVSLFGPTDPQRWAPIGPAVWVVAPERPSPMTWLEPGRVLDELRERGLARVKE